MSAISFSLIGADAFASCEGRAVLSLVLALALPLGSGVRALTLPTHS